MKIILKNALLITVLVVFASSILFNKKYNGKPTKTNGLILGVNGHPLNKKDYFDLSVHDQIALLKELGFTYYRIDVPMSNVGQVSNEVGFKQLIDQCIPNGIKVLPMLYTSEFDLNDDKKRSYEKGLKYGKMFGVAYGRYFSYVEIGNEQELQIVKKDLSGSNYADYDEGKLESLASYFKGMIKGIKQYQPKCKVIINTAGWFHFVYLELLARQNVDFDVIGYHWYSNMDSYAKTVNIDICDVLYKRFHKPIWFTEVNVFGGTLKNSETYQKQWVNEFILNSRKKKGVEAIFLYELLDEPNLLIDDSSEKTYGIIHTANNRRFKLIGKHLSSIKNK